MGLLKIFLGFLCRESASMLLLKPEAVGIKAAWHAFRL